jgi:hypothetical protein
MTAIAHNSHGSGTGSSARHASVPQAVADPGNDYTTRRRADGNTDNEIRRILKRARALPRPITPPPLLDKHRSVKRPISPLYLRCSRPTLFVTTKRRHPQMPDV